MLSFLKDPESARSGDSLHILNYILSNAITSAKHESEAPEAMYEIGIWLGAFEGIFLDICNDGKMSESNKKAFLMFNEYLTGELEKLTQNKELNLGSCRSFYEGKLEGFKTLTKVHESKS